MNKLTTYSVSKIQLYLECPYKYYLQYIAKTLPSKRTYHLQLGLAFSDIVEEIYSNYDVYKNYSEEDIQQLCDLYWVPKQYKNDFLQQKEPSWKFLGYNSLEQELVNKRNLYNWVLQYIATYGITPVFGVELELKCDIEGYPFYGRLDVAYFNRSKGLSIFDNKVGSTTYTLETNLQLILYTYACETIYNIPVYEAGIRYVVKNTWASATKKELDIQYGLNQFKSAIYNIQNNNFPKQPNNYCKYCQGCEHGSLL